MNLSSIITGVPEYIEFAYITAPATTGQSITAQTITTLELTDEVQDTGNLVSAPNQNQVSLPAGTYYFEATCPVSGAILNDKGTAVLGLYNFSDSQWVTRGKQITSRDRGDFTLYWSGQFKTTATKLFELKIYLRGATGTGTANINNGSADGNGAINFSAGVSTDLIDQRTTLRLWKLK